MMDTLVIETHGGISGMTNFQIYIEPGVEFEIITRKGSKRKIKCVEYTGSGKRQCFRCAFCHNINLCSHFDCGAHGMTKFKEIKDK